MIAIHLAPDDLLEMRLAYTPMIELVKSYFLLQCGKPLGLYTPWAEEARINLRGAELPLLTALVGKSKYIPDFLTPTPLTPVHSFEEALAQVRATPDDLIRKYVLELIRYRKRSDEFEFFLNYPREALECLIEELRDYWRRTLALHWPRMITVLENDVLYRARQLALNGADELFASLNSHITLTDNTIRLVKAKHDDLEFNVRGKGLHLVPSIFADQSWQLESDWPPMLIYLARGSGLWYHEVTPPEESLSLVIGEGKARILQSLDQPTNTNELAHRLSLTAGAVSQHLKRLSQAGLVESHRSGSRVFYRLSQRGERLLTLFME
jgi:DNA-binding transcriptional ArsR family regulator